MADLQDDIWTALKGEHGRIAALDARSDVEERAAERAEAEAAGYERQRLLAANDRISASMSRRLGHAVPLEYHDLPERADNRFDPRRW